MNIPRRVRPPTKAKDDVDQVLQMRGSWWRLGNCYYMSFYSMTLSILQRGGYLDAWYWLAERFGRWEVDLPDLDDKPVRFFTYRQAVKLSVSFPGAPLPQRCR